MDEILMGRAKLENLPADIQANLNILHERINKLRTAYGKPLKVNDGYRRAQDKPKNGAAQSKHFSGLAIDLDDNDSADLWKWCFANLQLMKDIGLWLEHPGFTHSQNGTWMHFQVVPPLSKKRIFIPSNNANPNIELWDGKYDKKYD